MAQILLVGQVQDSSNQDLLGNRSTLRASYVVLFVEDRTCCRLLALTVSPSVEMVEISPPI